ncbi:MAG TPA: hypothetical protein VEV61_07655 [Streptosporangiaceae bacterium]|nr:hypothetical protein [Streptosporangiaceae bacterium]
MSEHAGSHAAPHGGFRAAGRSLIGALQLLAVVGGIRRQPAGPPVGGFRTGAERHRRDALRPGSPVVVADHHRLDTVAPGHYAPRMADTVMFDGIVDTADVGSSRRSRPATS